MSVSMSVGGQGAFCFRHRLHAESPLIHHKLKYYLLFFTVKKTQAVGDIFDINESVLLAFVICLLVA